MSFLASLFALSGYLDFPRSFWGWLLGVSFLVVLVLVGRRFRVYHPQYNRTRWLLFAALVVLTPFTSIYFGLQMPITVELPPPGTPLQPVGHVLMVFAAFPWMLAAGLLGPIPTAVLAGMSGGIISIYDGHNPFTFLVYALLGLLVSAAIRQPYRTWIFRGLSRPLVAAFLVSLLYPLLFLATTVFIVGDSLPVRLDYAFSHLFAVAKAFGGMALLAALLAEVIAAAWPDLWYGKFKLLPSPIERSIESRLLYGLAPLLLVLVILLMAGNWIIADGAAREMLEDRLYSTGTTAANALPVALETGQNLISQIAADERLSTGETLEELIPVLIEHLNRVPFFHQLTLLDTEKNSIAAYPVTTFQGTLPLPEEYLGLDLALKGVVFQSYSLPPGSEHIAGRMAFIYTILDDSGEVQRVIIGRTELSNNPFIRPVIDHLSSLSEIEGAGMLVDDQGMILYHPDSDLVGTFFEEEFSQQAFIPNHTAPDGTRQMMYVNPVPGRSWATVTIVPVEMAQRVALENAVPMLGMMVVLALVGYGFLRLVMRMVTSSIQVLVEDSERISNGDLDHALALTGEDEVGQLGQSMEQMRINLKARMEEINRLLFVSRGVAEAMEIEVAVNPILEGALATGASSARLVLAPTAVTEFEQDAQTQFGMGSSSEKYQPLDMEVLKLTERQPVVILTNPRRAGLEDGSDMPAALMAVALRHENEHFGALWMAYDKPHKFTDDEQRFLTAVGGQAALAASNARLFLSGQLGRQRLEAVLTSTPGPVLVTDHQNRLLLANPAALALLGEEGGEPSSGTLVEDFIKHKELLALLVGDEAGQVEVVFPEKGIFYASVSPVVTEGQVMGKVCVLSEITRFKKLDALKSEFVATVSHDLRSPLTLVRGYATMMQMVGDLNEQQMDYIKKIVTGVESMSKMVNNLLDLGRIETGVGLRLEMVPVTDVVEQVTEAMRLQAIHKQVSIGVDLPEHTVPLVEADRTLIHQALQNLVENAIKYTRAGGRVAVGVKMAGDKAVFEVRDTGIGISPVDLPRVFERFYRVEGRGPKSSENRASGLGLTIVRSIAQRHGGEAWGESTLGKGSVFRMSIPLKQEKEEE